jgi:phosphatidylinositol kinase/protein kinase (PI-3  family)
VTTTDSSIRKTVLSCLDSRFDHHLAQAENLRSLFIALNDEVFEIRELAITTIGRLTIRNPAYVMPSLRKTLIQLLTELGACTSWSSALRSALCPHCRRICTHAHTLQSSAVTAATRRRARACWVT